MPSKQDAGLTAPSTAATLMEARRSRGLSVADVARVADLDESTVRSAESGDPVHPDVVDAVFGALSLRAPTAVRDPVPVVDPVDGEHAATMLRLRSRAAAHPGAFLVPDVAVWRERVNFASIVAANEAPVPGRETLWSTSTEASGGIVLAAVVFYVVVRVASVPVAGAVAMLCAAAIGAALVQRALTERRRGRGADRLLRARARDHDLRTRATVVGADGLTILTCRGDHVDVTHVGRGNIRSAEVRHLGSTHDDVTVFWVPPGSGHEGPLASWSTGPVPAGDACRAAVAAWRVPVADDDRDWEKVP